MNCPHCQIAVDEHPANRCLDAWVAEKVMGWESSYGDSYWIMLPPEGSTGRTEGRSYSVPPYSSSFSASMKILRNTRDYIKLERAMNFGENPPDYDFDWEFVYWHVQINGGSAVNKQLPLAICKAALLNMSDE